MTASERAALEAKAEALFFTVCPHQDRRETARAWHDCPRCVAEFAAAALLSSPPPAEREGWLAERMQSPAFREAFAREEAAERAAAPPASDERPSEERRWLTRDGTREMTPAELFRERHCADCIPGCACGKGRNEGHRDGCTHVCTHTFQRFAPAVAAPAPDEGRPQEKKLTHAASAPQRQSPTKGSDAGCDGEGSRLRMVAAVLEDVESALRDRKGSGCPDSALWDFDQVACWLTLALAGRYREAPASEAGGGETEGKP